MLTLNTYSKLPDTLISFLSAVPVLSSYRQSLANHLVTSQNEPRLSPIYNPVLKLVPKIAEQTDLMKLLIGLWDTKVKSSKRSERVSAVICLHSMDTLNLTKRNIIIAFTRYHVPQIPRMRCLCMAPLTYRRNPRLRSWRRNTPPTSYKIFL